MIYAGEVSFNKNFRHYTMYLYFYRIFSIFVQFLQTSEKLGYEQNYIESCIYYATLSTIYSQNYMLLALYFPADFSFQKKHNGIYILC